MFNNLQIKIKAMRINPSTAKGADKKSAKKLAMGRTSQPQSPSHTNQQHYQELLEQHNFSNFLPQHVGECGHVNLPVKKTAVDQIIKSDYIITKKQKKSSNNAEKVNVKKQQTKIANKTEKKTNGGDKINSKKTTAKTPLAAKLKKMLTTTTATSSPKEKKKPKEKIQISNNYIKSQRSHRMASLNALAKVHILYENESRGSPSDGSETDNGNSETASHDDRKKYVASAVNSQASNSSIKMATVSKNESKGLSVTNQKTNKKNNKKEETAGPSKNPATSKTLKMKPEKKLEPKKADKNGLVKVVAKKNRKRKALCEVEIIDTKACKRLACLNAQAILAASCTPERNRRISEKKSLCKVDEITINEKEIMTHEIVTDQSITQVTNHQTCTTVIRQKPSIAKQTSIHHNMVHASGRVVEARSDPKSILASSTEKKSEKGDKKSSHALCKVRTLSTTSESSGDVQTTVSNLGMTAEYTEVTKVQINTTKAMQLKEECKAKRTTIERILEKDDVAITRMYRYQTKGTSQSYCVKMHTTYKPSANKSFTPPPVTQDKTNAALVDGSTPEIIATVVHGDQGGYYNYNPHSVTVPNQQNCSGNHGGTVARVNGVPVVSVSPIVRHYSSAFTVPQYGASSPSHQAPISYSQGEYNKQGSYQPPVQDPCLIHKPIPYHPPQSPPHHPNGHSTPSSGQPITSTSHRLPPSSNHSVSAPVSNHFLPPHAHHQSSNHSKSSYPHPPPAHSSYSHDPCLSLHSLSSCGSPYPMDQVASSHQGYPSSRISPHVNNPSYQKSSESVLPPQQVHHHHHHHHPHQRSSAHPQAHPQSYQPPPLSPNQPPQSGSPSPVYHCHGSPYTQRHIYSPTHSPNYNHQDYASAPTYTVLSPVVMGSQKSNPTLQRIAQQVTVSPSVMHTNSTRGNRNSPATAPKAEPIVPTEISTHTPHNNFSNNFVSGGDYSSYPQPAYPTDITVSRCKANKTIAGVSPVPKDTVVPNCHQVESFIASRSTEREPKNRECGNWNLRSPTSPPGGGIQQVDLTTTTTNKARSAKSTCNWTRVQNVEVVTSSKQPNHRRLRAATVAATNSSLNAQRQQQQISAEKLEKELLSPDQSASQLSTASNNNNSKKKINSRINSSRGKSAPLEIDLTDSTEIEETCTTPKSGENALITTFPHKKFKKNNLENSMSSQSPHQTEGMDLVSTHPLSLCSMIPKKKGPKKFSNGWSWEGEPFDKLVFFSNDDPPCLRKCYPSMRHVEGDLINIRDCILLKSGPRKIDLPFVAKVAAMWETPEDGEMMVSLLWYYRPEHTEQGRRPIDLEDEIFASKHRDVNSVACIEDKCYVLTFSEYCRYRGRLRMFEDNYQSCKNLVPQPDEGYSRKSRLPPGRVSPEMVFVCRKVYDFRQKRLLKNPTAQERAKAS